MFYVIIYFDYSHGGPYICDYQNFKKILCETFCLIHLIFFFIGYIFILICHMTSIYTDFFLSTRRVRGLTSDLTRRYMTAIFYLEFENFLINGDKNTHSSIMPLCHNY